MLHRRKAAGLTEAGGGKSCPIASTIADWYTNVLCPALLLPTPCSAAGYVAVQSTGNGSTWRTEKRIVVLLVSFLFALILLKLVLPATYVYNYMTFIFTKRCCEGEHVEEGGRLLWCWCHAH